MTKQKLHRPESVGNPVAEIEITDAMMREVDDLAVALARSAWGPRSIPWERLDPEAQAVLIEAARRGLWCGMTWGNQ